jgi:hypothetical protein
MAGLVAALKQLLARGELTLDSLLNTTELGATNWRAS